MADVPAYVVDTSVAVKWILRLADEPHNDIAEAIQDEYRAGQVRLYAPAVIDYEIGHALLRAMRRTRIDPGLARAGLQTFYDLGIPTVSDRQVLLHAWQVSTRYGCSFYDSTYLALAELSRTPLIYADEHLRNLLEDRFPLALWIGDYQPLIR